MRKIVLITCLEQGDPLISLLEEQMKMCFNPKNTELFIYHGNVSCAEIALHLHPSNVSIPIEIGFDHSCTISRIGASMKAIRLALKNHKIQFYYRKKTNETLSPSIKKMACFEKLYEMQPELLVA